MSEAIEVARQGSLAGWPFWASVLTHIVGLGAVSAVAVTSASTPPPPVPIELVRLFAGYAYLDTEVIDSLDVVTGIPVEGKEIPNVARHTATLWTTWDITDQWQVGGGAFYSSRRFANNINTIEVPWYARGDVTVAYRPVKSFELRGNIINVSDERYTDGVHPSHAIPGTARTYLLTGTWSF